MELRLRRIVASGSFIPEIDGLRFIAIAGVVLFHLNLFLIEKDHFQYSSNYDSLFSFWNTVFSRGNFGVPLFFAVSGFVLARPFAEHFINGKPKVSLKHYFLRRVTRLEPPYVVLMTLLFVGWVFIAKQLPLWEGLKSYLCSICYIHNFAYGDKVLPLLNGVAWSLEIEVQFYILAPLLCSIFAIKQVSLRRGIVLVGIIAFAVSEHFLKLPFRSILNYIEFFLVGLLLADIFVLRKPVEKSSWLASLMGMGLLLLFLSIRSTEFKDFRTKLFLEFVELTGIFTLYYLILMRKALPFLSYTWITNLGGMCYSIYLLHVPILSVFGNAIVRKQFSTNALVNIGIYSIVLLGITLGASIVYFLLIERPCMDKDWPKKLMSRIRFLS